MKVVCGATHFSTRLAKNTSTLFHATHEVAPDALLVYFDSGPELDPIGHYFDKKRRDYLALLERLRKRNVPITSCSIRIVRVPARRWPPP